MQEDSPYIFPLYTEVMGKGKPKAEEGDRSQPEVPHKQLTEQNLTRYTEDIQQMDLLIEVGIHVFRKRDLEIFH